MIIMFKRKAGDNSHNGIIRLVKVSSNILVNTLILGIHLNLYTKAISGKDSHSQVSTQLPVLVHGWQFLLA